MGNMPTIQRNLGGALLVVLAVCSVGYTWNWARSGRGSSPGVSDGQTAVAGTIGVLGDVAYGTVPDFAFTDRRGRTVRRADLLGKVWVADFIFTNCAGTCPVMTMRMKGLLETLKDLSGVALVSFSVDPDRDTPEVLDEYAAGHGADDERWHFLTGDRAAVYKLSRDGFRLAVGEVPPEELRPGDEAIMHSDRFALVDRQGRIRGLYRGAGPDSEVAVRQLAEDIRKLLDNPPAP